MWATNSRLTAERDVDRARRLRCARVGRSTRTRLSASTPSPTPTLSASSPSFPEITSSPSASCTRGGNASPPIA